MQHWITQHKQIGRPKAAEGKKKIYNLTVRLSDADLMELADKASKAGLSFSRFLREAGLGRELPRPVPPINLQTHQELGRIGSNLNQLIKRIYEGYFEGNAIATALEELTQVIRAIRKELRGQ
ncbi:plasmid mobilization protein [Geotalea toluenoxydans]|uniref:plasmid mobilization protein n=1 Tax=Geotalea toluenoxydans TaxID=421624 RepID=UPI0006D092B0|nr:plasmid mobilization relaxosome protein MobC [Geotalea toluenoxydans]